MATARKSTRPDSNSMPKTPAQIISEAKEELLKQTRDKIRIVKTNRPYTPKDDQRTLFGQTANRYTDRPPSSFSLGSHHFDGIDSRPPSGTIRPPSGSVRLAPIDDALLEGVVPKPPSGDPTRRRNSRASRTIPQKPVEAVQMVVTPRSGSCGDLKQQDDLNMVGNRRVHSGPKERTSPMAENNGNGYCDDSTSLGVRGEGDGEEFRDRFSSSSKHDVADSDFSEMYIQPLLDQLKHNTLDDGQVTRICDQLYERLHSEDLLHKLYEKRSSILKAVFRLMDRTSPQLLLSLARIILAFKVSGNNLSSVCKLIFKVSRDKENDQLFARTNVLDLMLDAMLHMETDKCTDALTYCCGAVKFLAGNKSLSESLSQKSVLYVLASVLKRINKQGLEVSHTNEKLVQVLVQLTSALRKFAEQNLFTSQFEMHNVIDELCVASVIFSADYELMLNVASTLSKLTVHENCCHKLANHPSCYRSLLKLLNMYTHKEDLVLRLCFVLGNLAAVSEENRLSFCSHSDSMPTLISVFEHYMHLLIKDSSVGTSTQSIKEVLIKLIRLLANLSVSEDIGLRLCDEKKCIDFLLHILEVKEISSDEELILNCLALINNLSFYSSPGTYINENHIEISRCLMKLLLQDNKDGLMEVCRIYGNLTRSQFVRDFLCTNSVLEIMITLLDSGDQELVYSCCGVLVNFMCDEDKRPVLKRESGVPKLIDVLRDFATSDWQLAGLVCQVFWNYSTDIKSARNTFGDDASQLLISLLNDYIDDPQIPDLMKDEELRKYLHQTWRSEFCSVAAQLRKRIKNHQSKFVELPPRTT